MLIGPIDHYSIRTNNLVAAQRFYTEVLGFTVGYRPPFAFPGVWLYNGDHYPDSNGVVHLVGVDPNDNSGLLAYLGDRDAPADGGLSRGGGVIDHIAFRANDIWGLRRRLALHRLLCTERTVPELGLHQVFVADPDGVIVELNFSLTESP